MQSTKKNTGDKKKLNFFEIFVGVLAWLQIVASPLIIAAIIGFIVYISNPNTTTLSIGIAITAAGLIVGIIWATKIWKKKGTIHFVSRIMATPELDPPDEVNK